MNYTAKKAKHMLANLSKTRLSYLILVFFFMNFKIYAQMDVIAIDILLDPDQTMLDSAKVYNEMMRKNYSGAGSFALDAAHKPHISVLQCFVKKADLERVYATVAKVVKQEHPTNEPLKTKGFYYIPTNGLGLAGITVHPNSKLLNFQSKLIESIKPFMVQGTDAAFVQNADGKPITAGTADYVNTFFLEQIGTKFNPHVTIGLAHEAFLKELIARPYQEFPFKSTSVSIYQLGDLGTAQKKLWTSSK